MASSSSDLHLVKTSSRPSPALTCRPSPSFFLFLVTAGSLLSSSLCSLHLQLQMLVARGAPMRALAVLSHIILCLLCHHHPGLELCSQLRPTCQAALESPTGACSVLNLTGPDRNPQTSSLFSQLRAPLPGTAIPGYGSTVHFYDQKSWGHPDPWSHPCSQPNHRQDCVHSHQLDCVTTLSKTFFC